MNRRAIFAPKEHRFVRPASPIALGILAFAWSAWLGSSILWGQDATPTKTAARARRLPGVHDAGEILLPNQWSLRPAGKQIKLGDFPVQIALHPSSPWAAILHAGYGEHEIVIVDLTRQRVRSRAAIPQTFYGICWNPAGTRLFASGAEDEVVHQFDFAEGFLSGHRELMVAPPSATFVPTGVTCSADGATLYVANAWGDTLCVLPVNDSQERTHVAFENDSYPYASLVSADGKRLFVSLWGRSCVAVLNLQTLKVETEWKTQSHPTEMVLSPDGDRLFVACANSNTVSVLNSENGAGLEVLSSALYPKSPPGSTPNSLSLTPDGKVLCVANADNNNVAMFDVSQAGKARALGHIPVGWYPTSARFHPKDGRLYVANGKGLMSRANPQGPRPLSDVPETVEQYVGGLFQGSLSVIDAPAPADMTRYTEWARECSPLREDLHPPEPAETEDNPIPAKPGGPSPIKHCIYIIKENRTYDQVFGDMPEGNGDPALCIFPETVTPNHHALAREFVLLDNFYVESEVSADGHEWSMAAYATDFVEKSWPLSYRGGKGKLKYPSEGEAEGTIATPAGGYIWDRCKAAGVSYRSYGEFVLNAAKVGDPATTRVHGLVDHFDPYYRSYDLDYPDALRTDRFIEELRGFEKRNDLPQFIVLRLPNDHTFGQSAGKPTPTAMVAENDLALGRLVEAVSASKFWKQTAIFVVEDDAQNGSDHVDAHRTVALVISPFCKRGSVDSCLYSTSSMLRSMELILGLEPMSQFDAAARPMYASFQAELDAKPYRHRPAQVDLAAVNSPNAWGANASAQLDFSKEDAADDLLLNDIVWRSVRGPNSPMPPPVRASFVYASSDEDDEHEEREDEDDDDDDD